MAEAQIIGAGMAAERRRKTRSRRAIAAPRNKNETAARGRGSLARPRIAGFDPRGGVSGTMAFG